MTGSRILFANEGLAQIAEAVIRQMRKHTNPERLDPLLSQIGVGYDNAGQPVNNADVAQRLLAEGLITRADFSESPIYVRLTPQGKRYYDRFYKNDNRR